LWGDEGSDWWADEGSDWWAVPSTVSDSGLSPVQCTVSDSGSSFGGVPRTVPTLILFYYRSYRWAEESTDWSDSQPGLV
jgi:hypothetical protein